MGSVSYLCSGLPEQSSPEHSSHQHSSSSPSKQCAAISDPAFSPLRFCSSATRAWGVQQHVCFPKPTAPECQTCSGSRRLSRCCRHMQLGDRHGWTERGVSTCPHPALCMPKRAYTPGAESWPWVCSPPIQLGSVNPESPPWDHLHMCPPCPFSCH